MQRAGTSAESCSLRFNVSACFMIHRPMADTAGPYRGCAPHAWIERGEVRTAGVGHWPQCRKRRAALEDCVPAGRHGPVAGCSLFRLNPVLRGWCGYFRSGVVLDRWRGCRHQRLDGFVGVIGSAG